jgi:hypothetical protein
MEMENIYILGDVFLKNYYQVYNLENNTVSLGVNFNSSLTLIKEIPTNDDGKLPGSAIFFIIVLVLLVVGLAGGAGYYYYNKK